MLPAGLAALESLTARIKTFRPHTMGLQTISSENPRSASRVRMPTYRAK